MPFIGKQPAVGSFTLLDSITTSATATYALTKNGDAFYPETARNLLVSLNGVTQAPEDAYTVSGSNIVFASALTASDVIDYILVLGDVLDIGQPSDGTVGTSQMNYPLDNFSSTGIDDNASSTAVTINSNDDVGIGVSNPATNTLRYFDVYNTDTGAAAGVITRLITYNAAGTGTTSVDLVKYKNGSFYINNNEPTSAANIIINTGGAERMRIDSDGLKFNGDTATANALDDYEEGDIDITTMYFTGSGSATNHTGYDTLRYVKVGNTVTVTGNIYLNSVTSQSGYLKIPLPFVNGSQVKYRTTCAIGNYQSNNSTVALIESGDNYGKLATTSGWGVVTVAANQTYVVNLNYNVA